LLAGPLPPDAEIFTTSGVYTAPATVTAPQTVIVTATTQANPSQIASSSILLVQPGGSFLPVSLSVTPLSATLYGGQTQQLTAIVNNTTNTGATWTLDTVGVGTISATGLYAAPATITAPQTVTITATSQADTSVQVPVMVSLSPTPCASSGYSCERTIVINHTQVSNTDQTNFPILFNMTDPTIAAVANGGHVTSSNGYDIIFSSDPNGTTKLDRELEQYNPATGQVVAWVRIPTLSHSANTTLYVFYGNSAVTTPQQNPTGVWDINYRAVYHFANAGRLLLLASLLLVSFSMVRRSENGPRRLFLICRRS
jgi:Domain of unknown function (DUF2341)